MTTAADGDDAVQIGNSNREKNLSKNITKRIDNNMQEKLVNGTVSSKESVNEDIGAADLKLVTKNVFAFVMY